MEKLITLYHGSEQLVEEPTFGKGKKNNDFGLGFYCTKSEDLAKEWAVSSLRNGFANRYTLDTEYLNILNLNGLGGASSVFHQDPCGPEGQVLSD